MDMPMTITTTSTDAPHSPPLAYAVAAVESFIHLAVLPLTVFNLHAIVSTAVLHVNMKLMLLIQSFAILLHSVSRPVQLGLSAFTGRGVFNHPVLAVDFLNIFGMVLTGLIGYALVIERIYATWRVRTYERETGVCFAASSLALILPSALAITLPEVLKLKKRGGNFYSTDVQLSSVVAIYMGTLLSLSTMVILARLYRHNKAKYASDMAQMSVRGHSLSERYQLAENMRTTKQLVPVLGLHSISNLQISIATLLTYHGVNNTVERIAWNVLIMDVFNGIVYFFIQLAVITHHPLLLRRSTILLNKFKKFVLHLGGRPRRVCPSETLEMQYTPPSAAPTDHQLQVPSYLHLHHHASFTGGLPITAAAANGRTCAGGDGASFVMPLDIHGEVLFPASANEADFHFRMLTKYWATEPLPSADKKFG